MMLSDRSLPCCLLPIFTHGNPIEGDSMIPQDEFPTMADACFRRPQKQRCSTCRCSTASVATALQNDFSHVDDPLISLGICIWKAEDDWMISIDSSAVNQVPTASRVVILLKRDRMDCEMTMGGWVQWASRSPSTRSSGLSGRLEYTEMIK